VYKLTSADIIIVIIIILRYYINQMFCGKPSNRKNKAMGTPMGCLRKGIGIGLGLKKKPAKKAPPKKAPPKKAPKKAAPKKAPKKAPPKKAKKPAQKKMLAIKAPPKSKLKKKEQEFIDKKDKLKQSISKLLADDDYSQFDQSDKRKMGILEDDLEDLIKAEKGYYRKKLGN
jgi:glucan-binding YG repeat protein